MKRFKYIFEYIVLFALNGIMLWFFRGYLNLFIAAGMILFLLYALISVHIVRTYLSVTIQVPADSMMKNTTFLAHIRLENRCVLPLVTARICMETGNIFLGEKTAHDLIVPVKPMGTTVVEYPLRSDYVGNVEITAVKIVLEDLLGFHAVSREVQVTKNVFVIPSGGAEQEFVLNDFEKGMDEVEESKLKGSDFSDVSQVREYVPGDALKNIHWKLSAKRDVLMVKERLQMSSRKLLAVLSLEKDDPQKADETVEMLDAMGRFFIRGRVPVTLFWWSEKYREIREQTADSEEEWGQLVMNLFYTGAGSGMAEEQFKSLNPGRGYVLVSRDGVVVKE